MVYFRRVVDSELDTLLPGLPAIALRGARGVGKTSTALQRAATVYRLDRPEVLAIAAADPDRLTSGRPPILIDEWQLYPASWDLVRRAVDAEGTPGRLLLTGSTSPRNPPTHTGAGRIVPVQMRPMTFAERGLETPTVSLAGLLRSRRSDIGGTTDVGLRDYARAIIGSGFPGLQGLPERAVRAQLTGYVDQIVERDVEEAGATFRNPPMLRRWLAAYAAAVSSTTSFAKIREAATATRIEPPAKGTAARYADILESIWILDPVPAWTPAGTDLRRLTVAPKHQLVDPAIAASLRGATMDALLAGAPAGALSPRHSTLMGALFEAAVSLNVRVDAQGAEARTFHFRSSTGSHEVDLIVEGMDGRVVGMEVKLVNTPSDEDGRQLRWLRHEIGDRLVDAVIVTTGREAYRRRDGMAVVPAALLGP